MKELIIFNHYNYLVYLLHSDTIVWDSIGGTEPYTTKLKHIVNQLPYGFKQHTTLFYFNEE